MSRNFRSGFKHEINKDLGLDYLEEMVKQDDVNKWDATVPLDEIKFTDEGRLATPDGEFEMTEYAQTQFFTRIGIPAAYGAKCPANIMKSHADYWLEKYKETSPRVKNWLVRFRGDKVRAVLTDAYSVFDNKHILEALKQASLHTRFNVVSCDVSGEAFHARLASPEASREFANQDVFWGGIHLSNREVGGGSAKAEYLLFRLVCSNGLVGIHRGGSYRRVHRGFTLDLVDAFVAQLGAVLANYEVNIKQAFSDLDKARGEITERGVDLTRYIAMELGLGRDRAEAAAYFASEEATRFDIINAMTEGAHNFSGDKRYEMEAAAGTLLYRSILPYEMAMKQKEQLEQEKKEAAKRAETAVLETATN